MFPLFTVYMTTMIKNMLARQTNAVTALQIKPQKKPGS